MTQTIQDIRKQIDATDRQIHDLLIERAKLAQLVAAEKRKSGAKMIQPDREAIKIRSIIEHHSGDLPLAGVVRMWREIISSVSLLQTDIKVAIAPSPAGHYEYRDMARDYFGSVIPVHESSNILSAISAVREGEAQFAVLPWPNDESENPWWTYLESDSPDKALRIAVRLPYVDGKGGRGQPEHRALVIARQAFAPSGDDHSFVILDLDQTVSRARVLDKAKAMGMNVISISSKRPRVMADRSLHLVEIDSFISVDDARLADLLEKLESPDGKAIVVGGYPVMPGVK